VEVLRVKILYVDVNAVSWNKVNIV
jgi:hypothetical protein